MTERDDARHAERQVERERKQREDADVGGKREAVRKDEEDGQRQREDDQRDHRHTRPVEGTQARGRDGDLHRAYPCLANIPAGRMATAAMTSA